MMQIDIMKELKPMALLFMLGFLGIASIIPFIPQLLAAQAEPPTISTEIIQVISVVQSSVLLFLMVLLGAIFSKKVGLTSPVVYAIARSINVPKQLKPQIIPTIIGGVVGGVFILVLFGAVSGYLPPEFLKAGEKLAPPWYAKILYGGITEEILIRWGLMSFLVWGLYRLTQQKGTAIQPYNYVFAIIISALIFGAAHLPVAFALSPEVTIYLVAYIILGNTVFGLIAGYLYWKHGLECAIGAHMIVHVVMIVGAHFA